MVGQNKVYPVGDSGDIRGIAWDTSNYWQRIGIRIFTRWETNTEVVNHIFLIGKPTINGVFSTSSLLYQRATTITSQQNGQNQVLPVSLGSATKARFQLRHMSYALDSQNETML